MRNTFLELLVLHIKVSLLFVIVLKTIEKNFIKCEGTSTVSSVNKKIISEKETILPL